MHIFSLFILFSLIPTTNAATYRWTDNNGNTVYSQIPPSNNKEVIEILPPPPPAEKHSSTKERLQTQLQLLEDRQEDRENLKRQNQKKSETALIKQKNCQAAKKALSAIEKKARLLFKMKNGEYKRMKANEKSEKVDQLNTIIHRDCS